MRAQADAVELDAATLGLWQHLFHGSRPPVRTGRLRFLTDMIASRSELRHALRRAGDSRMVTSAWNEALVAGATDVRFLHGLAVLHREQALVARHAGTIREAMEPAATALWALLFGTASFWESVNEADPELERQCIESVLVPHAKAGRRALASDRPDIAGVHLRCLDLVRRGHAALVEALETYHLPFGLEIDETRFEHIGARAAELIEEWSRAVIVEAERAAENPMAGAEIATLSKNFEAALVVVGEFLRLEVPVVGALAAVLGWYNEWCFELYVGNRWAELCTVTDRAGRTAEQLALLAERRQGFRPANQALSRHFVIRGFVAGGSDDSIAHFEDALTWDETNDNAARLLEDSQRMDRKRRLNKQVRSEIDGRRWPEAYQAVEAAEGAGVEDEQVAGLRAIVWYEHARWLRNERRPDEARAIVRTALEHAPAHALLKRLADELEGT